MKSNDIIDAVNLFLKDKRIQYSTDIKGHFVLHTSVENKIGPMKKYCYRVFFVNKDLKPCPVGDVALVLQARDGQEEENYRQMDMKLTRLMFTIFNTEGWLKHFILGDYGTNG